MKMKKLKELAKLFRENNHRLLLVGGFVRDGIMKSKTTDIDIASSATPKEVKQICADAFKVKESSPKLGTLIIEAEDFSCEYTPFRTEKYATGTTHSPSEVVFEDSIVKDAYRRDFSINCLYKDILTGKIFDPYGGIKDIKRKKIRQIHNQVFDVDPLRILRMVRFSSVLGFKIDTATFESAKQNANKIQNLSSSRISKELEKIISSKYAQTGIKNLMRLGFLPNKKLYSFKFYPSLATLAHDLFAKDEKELIKFLNKCCTSGTQIKQIQSAITFANAFDAYPCVETCINNEPNLGLASKLIKKQSKLIECLNEIIEKKLPLDVSQLAIRGTDLKELGVAPTQIGSKLENLLLKVVKGEIENRKVSLIAEIKGAQK